jgi:predicted nucleic acid-binding protein
MFVVDSCIIIDCLNGYEPAKEWLRDNFSQIYIPGAVVLEVLHPNLNDKQTRQVTKFVDSFGKPKNPSGSDWNRAINAYKNWDRANAKPGVIDLIIAHTAAGLDATVATRNEKDFKLFKGCKWMKPYPDP